MSNQTEREVAYGNLGPALYDSRKKEWRFSRNNVDDTRLRVIEQETVFPGQQGYLHKDFDHPTTARARIGKINALLNTFPELIPGGPSLPVLEQASRAISDLAYIYEPLACETLAYGAVDYDEKLQILANLRQRKILASVTGAGRHVVRLSLVTGVRRVPEGEFHGAEFMVNNHRQGSVSFWRGETRTAILQLCFSKATTGSSLLAVRRCQGVDILKPVIRKNGSYESKLTDSEIGTGEQCDASNLDPNWLVHVSLDHSDHLMIIDLAFHPERSMELAILGSNDEVMVLHIDEPQNARHPWSVSYTTKISRPDNGPQNHSGDAWGIILWTDNGNSILLAGRQTLLYCNLLSPEPSMNDLSSELLPQQPHSILDLQHEDSTNLCFILTTYNVIVVSRSSSDGESVTSKQYNYRKLVSIIHCRDAEDQSMRLSVEACNRYLIVLIYSRIVPLVTGYKVIIDEETGTFQSITDPFRFVLPGLKVSNVSESTSLFPKMASLISYLTTTTVEIRPPHRNTSPRDCLLHILVLDNGYGLTQMIVAVQNSGSSFNNLALIPIIAQENPRLGKGHTRGGLNFVVENDSDSEEAHKLQSSRQYLLPYPEKQSLPFSNDFTFLADELNSRLDASYVKSQSMGSFDTVLETVLSNRSDAFQGIHLLSEFLPGPLPVDAVDTVSRQTVELLDAIHGTADSTQNSFLGQDKLRDLLQALESDVLLFGQTLRAMKENDATETLPLVLFYEKILQLYLHALPTLVPVNARVWLEKIIRQAAMQFFLSSHSVQSAGHHDTLPVNETQEPIMDGHGSQQISLPMRARNADLVSIIAKNKSKESDVLQEQLYYPNLEVGRGSSSQEVPNNEHNHGESINTTLGQYVEFRVGSPIHRNMRKHIPEWHIGEVPTGLEWRSLSRSASQESLASVHSSRQRKKDKGKGRAPATINDPILAMPGSGVVGPLNSTGEEYDQDMTYNLDDALLASQVSSFPSSQLLPRMEKHHTITLASQPILAQSSQADSFNPQVRSRPLGLKKSLGTNKRPSGFR